jgi:hypothetical protein
MASEKALELLKDKSFIEELVKTGSAQDAQKLFAAKGADISVDELLALRAKVKQEIGEELGDEELALVAGGAVITVPVLKPDIIDLIGDRISKKIGDGSATPELTW